LGQKLNVNLHQTEGVRQKLACLSTAKEISMHVLTTKDVDIIVNIYQVGTLECFISKLHWVYDLPSRLDLLWQGS
jgi:hypothetical protein